MDLLKMHNELQALRTDLAALEAELHNDAVCGRDLLHGKARSVLHAEYSVKLIGRKALEHRINELVKELAV